MNKFGKISVIVASLALPVTLLVSGFVAWQLKESNPNSVDITSNMAYLKEILGTSLILFTTLWIVSLVCALIGFKKDSSKDFSKLGMLVLVLVTVFSIGAGMFTNAVGDAEDAARQKQAEEFFEKIQ